MKEAEVVWALAHIAPATPKEVEEFMDTDTSASTTVTNCWRNGLLIRRRRERPGTIGSDPFEYHLRSAEDSDIE